MKSSQETGEGSVRSQNNRSEETTAKDTCDRERKNRQVEAIDFKVTSDEEIKKRPEKRREETKKKKKGTTKRGKKEKS